MKNPILSFVFRKLSWSDPLWGLLLVGAGVLGQGAPEYVVDASWPRELPNDWILGQVSGIAVDGEDHVWIVHRPRSISESEAGAVQDPPLGECCVPAPSVLQFDGEGNLLRAWGGPTWNRERQDWDAPPADWPANEHGIFIDDEGHVWLGANGPTDRMVLKYTAEGEHLLTIGGSAEGVDSNDTGLLGRPADLFVDTAAREVFVADGYGNRRIAVFDSETGEYKRHWGAYGERPEDGTLPPYDPDAERARQFLGPVHSIVSGPEGLLYVADRTANRLQVFERDGSFVREALLAPATLGNGSVWDLAFGPQGRWLFVADGRNMKVWILDAPSLQPAGEFGRGGRQAGQFDWVHNVAVDSAGNVYTAEVNNGRRIQKFVPAAP